MFLTTYGSRVSISRTLQMTEFGTDIQLIMNNYVECGKPCSNLTQPTKFGRLIITGVNTAGTLISMVFPTMEHN